MKKLYKKISSITQDRKNELLETFNQVQSESSIQLSSSTQASSSSSSSIKTISTTQNRTSFEPRTQYEPDIRQNRYTDIRNQTAEPRHEDRPFNPESRYDRGPDRPRNRQYEITEYADENPCSVNQTRRASQPDYQASEPYAPSSSQNNQSDERIIYAKELSALNKLYKDEEKFGSTRNNFDFKLTIYLDKCKFADLSEHVYGKEISLMLTNEALTYYYANRDNFITFNDFCTSMRLYFESSE